MTRQTVLLSLLMTALAAAPGSAQTDGEEALNESLTCPSVQFSGSGENFFVTCVSDTGNVALFGTRAGGGDNIDQEGYMICDAATGGPFVGRAWSSGTAEFNLAVPTTRTATSNVRTTADGRYRLSQTFTRDAVDKQMIITMTLRNLGPGAMSDVRLQRFIAADADNALASVYVRGADSILATSGDGGRGLVMGTLTPEIPHTTAVSTFSDFNGSEHDDCRVTFPQATPTAAGEFVGYIGFSLGNLAAGAAKTVKVYYRKF